MKHLQRHKAAGRLIYRRAYPADLRPHAPGTPRELIRTLGAFAIDEPGALERYKAAHAEYERTLRHELRCGVEATYVANFDN